MTLLSPSNTALQRQVSAHEHALRALRAEMQTLRASVAACELAIGDLRVSLLSFEGRYIRQVGILFKQLDEWNAKREALHPRPAEADAEHDNEAAHIHTSATESTTALRALFRELARLVHPDFARDEVDAARRTRLMSQANEAFLRRDHRTLERMLHGHDVAIEFSAAASTTAAFEKAKERHGRLRQDLAAAEAELQSLAASDLAQLRDQVFAAARDGRDLLAETAVRLQGLIGIAMRQYELDVDRIKRPPRGLNVETLLSAETPKPPQLRYDSILRRWKR